MLHKVETSVKQSMRSPIKYSIIFRANLSSLKKYIDNVGYVLINDPEFLKETLHPRPADERSKYKILNVHADNRCMLHALALLVGKETAYIKGEKEMRILWNAVGLFVHEDYEQLVNEGDFNYLNSEFADLLIKEENKSRAKAIYAALKTNNPDVTHLVVGYFHSTVVIEALDMGNDTLEIKSALGEAAHASMLGSGSMITVDLRVPPEDITYIAWTGGPIYRAKIHVNDKYVFVCTNGVHYTLVVPQTYTVTRGDGGGGGGRGWRRERRRKRGVADDGDRRPA